MSNSVSAALPAGLDAFLQYFAQATGKIGYGDIIALGRVWPHIGDKKDAILAAAESIEKACAESMLGHDEAMQSDENLANIADGLAAMVISEIHMGTDIPDTGMPVALSRAAEFEKELDAAIDSVKAAIEKDAAAVSIPGMEKISGHIFTLPARNLGESWDPRYYDADLQKELVHEKLSKVSTLSGLRNALRSMVTDRKLVIHPLVRDVLCRALDNIGAAE